MKPIALLVILIFNISCIEQSQDKHSPVAGFDPVTQSCQSFSPYTGKNIAPCTDFKGIDISNLNFDNLDLRGSDFSNANIDNTSFHKSNLSGARFFRTKINKSNFDGSKLSSTTFKYSTISETTFVKSTGDKVLIEDSNLNNVNLQQSYLPTIKIVDSKIFKGYFTNSFLENSTWIGVILRESNLSQSKMSKSKIVNSDFSTNFLEFFQSSSDSVMLSKENLLDGIDLRESIIDASNFNLVSMTQSRLQKSKITMSLFRGVNLEQSALTYCMIQEVDFSSIIGINLTEEQKKYFVLDEYNNYILKQKTKLNYLEAHNVSIINSLLNHIEMSHSNLVQSNFSYSSSSYSLIQDNQFNESGFYQAKFFKNHMRSNNFYRSNLGVEQYVGFLPQADYSIEFIESDLSFSVFDQVLWYFENINTQKKMGPNFSNSVIVNSFWNYSDIRFGNIGNTDINFSNLQNALTEGVLFNQSTKIPFEFNKALELGMIYTEE